MFLLRRDNPVFSTWAPLDKLPACLLTTLAPYGRVLGKGDQFGNTTTDDHVLTLAVSLGKAEHGHPA